MFVENKYYHWYCSLMASTKSRELIRRKGYELHHFIPKSFGGSRQKENIRCLTYREHFIAHKLLTKCTVGIYLEKMKWAFRHLAATTMRSNLTSRQFELIKSKNKPKRVAWNKGKTWTLDEETKRQKTARTKQTNLEKYGGSPWTGRKHKEETKAKISAYRSGRKMPKWVGEKISASNKGISYEKRFGKERAEAMKKRKREYWENWRKQNA